MINGKHYIILMLLIILLVSCSSGSNNDTVSLSGKQISVKIQKVECVFEKISPAKSTKQLLELSGNSPKSEIIELQSQTNLRVYWNQLSTQDFELSIADINSDQANNTANTIILESIIGPSSGCTDVTLEAGDYKVIVDNANNDWKVLLEAITN